MVEPRRLEHLIAQYLYTQLKPLNDNIINLLETKPKLLERPRILELLWSKITTFIQIFHDITFKFSLICDIYRHKISLNDYCGDRCVQIHF